MTRSEILKRADSIVNGERQKTYGRPEDSFTMIAALWSGYLDECITRIDVANMMIMLKIAREKCGEGKADNWIDICGYGSIGGEISTTAAEDAAKTVDELGEAGCRKLLDAIFRDNHEEADEDDNEGEWPGGEPTDWWTDKLTGCQVGVAEDGWVHVSLNRHTLPFGTAGFSDKTIDALIKSIGKSINEEVVDENKKNMMAMLWAVKRYKERKEDEGDED
jgi:hypothetical protein